MWIVVFWVVTCSLVGGYHLQVKAVGSAETFGNYLQYRSHNPEDYNPHFYRRENLRSQDLKMFYLATHNMAVYHHHFLVSSVQLFCCLNHAYCAVFQTDLDRSTCFIINNRDYKIGCS
jgi:hypothetical protein